MFVYFLLVGIIGLDFLIEYLVFTKNKNENHSKAFYFFKKLMSLRVITIFALVFFATFKSLKVGLDTKNYYNWYQNLLENGKQIFDYEYGFVLLSQFLTWLGLGFWSIWFVSSLFASISLTYLLNKVSKNKIMSFVLYLALGIYAQSLSALRQIFAMAFIFLATAKLYDKKYIPALIFIVCASLFHASAAVCLILPFLTLIKPKWYIIVCFFAGTVVLSLIFPPVLKAVSQYLPVDYYDRYFVKYDGFITETSLINIYYTIGLIFIFLVFYFAKFKLLKFDEEQSKMYDFFLLIFMFVPGIRIMGFMLNMQELFTRLVMYFFFSLLILIPLFVEGLKYNKKLFIASKIAVYVVAIGYMYYLYAIRLSCGVVPYSFCFA